MDEVCGGTHPSSCLFLFRVLIHYLFQGMPDAKPFRSVSFPIYDMMAQLVEDTVADGRSVVHLGKNRQHEESDHELEGSPITQSDDATDSGEEGAEDQPADVVCVIRSFSIYKRLVLIR